MILTFIILTSHWWWPLGSFKWLQLHLRKLHKILWILWILFLACDVGFYWQCQLKSRSRGVNSQDLLALLIVDYPLWINIFKLLQVQWKTIFPLLFKLWSMWSVSWYYTSSNWNCNWSLCYIIDKCKVNLSPLWISWFILDYCSLSKIIIAHHWGTLGKNQFLQCLKIFRIFAIFSKWVPHYHLG